MTMKKKKMKEMKMYNLFIILHRSIYLLLNHIFGTLRKHKFIFMNKPPDLPTNVIYAVNHSCKYDVPYACEAINRQHMCLWVDKD